MATMIREAATPPMTTVLRRQLVMLHWSGRSWFLGALTVAIIAAAAPILAFYGYDVGTLFFDFAPALMFSSGLFGLFVWRDEPPNRRDYHWTLPVDAGRHDLLRVAAGALWLAAGILGFTLTGAVVAFAAGSGDAWVELAPLMLPHYVLSSYILYLLAAALSTRSNRPVEFAILGYVGLTVLITIAGLARIEWLREIIEAALSRPVGLGWAVIGGLHGAERLAETSQQSEIGSYYREWLPVALLWLAISVGLLWTAARVRIGRR